MIKAVEEFRQIIDELDASKFESENDFDTVCSYTDELNAWCCDVFDCHDYVLDQCGFWQHKFCKYCSRSQYPDLAKQSCSTLAQKMGKTTEEEYIKSLECSSEQHLDS